MAIYDVSVGLENFMLRAGQISQRIAACHSEAIALPPAPPPAGYPGPEPMQVDANRLTSMVRARRLSCGLCLYCGSSGHFIRACPTHPPGPAVSTLHIDPAVSTLKLLTVQLLIPSYSISVPALIDSGTSGNFITQNLLNRLQPVVVSNEVQLLRYCT